LLVMRPPRLLWTSTIAQIEYGIANRRTTMKRICLSIFLLAATSGVASAADCDRACLKGLITKYMDAMVAHKPELLPLASNARFSEDSKDLKLGEGLWKDITKVGAFPQEYLDLK